MCIGERGDLSSTRILELLPGEGRLRIASCLVQIMTRVPKGVVERHHGFSLCFSRIVKLGKRVRLQRALRWRDLGRTCRQPSRK
jgi:hypothetical protein